MEPIQDSAAHQEYQEYNRAETAPGGEIPPPRATGLRRWLYVCLGLFFVGMAYLGAILPGLPTTPFVLLASYFFARSSRRLQRWLRRTPYFGSLLKDWETHRGLRRRVKITATCLVIIVVTYSLAFTTLPLRLKAVIAGLAGLGLATIWLLIRTIRPQES